MAVFVPLPPGLPPGPAQHKARKGNELLCQQALHGILAVGKGFGLLYLQAVAMAL